eukprot:scaffold880_cov384-Prasinococcus_capsulatus_cf.AAC.4
MVRNIPKWPIRCAPRAISSSMTDETHAGCVTHPRRFAHLRAWKGGARQWIGCCRPEPVTNSDSRVASPHNDWHGGAACAVIVAVGMQSKTVRPVLKGRGIFLHVNRARCHYQSCHPL